MDSFFQLLTQQLSNTLAADCVFIGEWKSQSRRLSVVAASGAGAESLPAEFDLLNTPFQPPGSSGPNGPFVHRQGAAQHFPQDPVLQRIPGETYAGSPLRDSSGNLLGVIGVITRHPLEESRQTEALMKVASMSAAHEMEVHAQMQNILDENAQLRHSGSAPPRPGEGEPQAAPPSEHQPVTLEEAQRSHVLRTLEATHWVIEGSHGAAALLKLPPSTLRSLMKRLGVRRAPRQQPPPPQGLQQ